MRPPLSALSQITIGLEATPGVAVKGQWMLDAASSTLKGVGIPIRSKAVTGTRQVKKVVMGSYEIQGDLSFEVTPDKWTKILYAAMPNLATTGGGDPYTHVYKSSDNLLSLTAKVRYPQTNGDMHTLFPGLFVKMISLKAQIDAILEATVSFLGAGTEIVSMGNFVSGTGTVSASGVTVTGVGTTFTTDFTTDPADLTRSHLIQIGGYWHSIVSITSNTVLTVNSPFFPTFVPGTAYFTVANGGINDSGLASSTESPFVFFQGVVAIGGGGTGAGTAGAAGTAVTGVGTAFDTTVSVGDIITIASQARVVQTVTSATAIVVTQPFLPTIAPGATYTTAKGNADTNNWQIDIDTGVKLFKGIGAGRSPNRGVPGDEVVKGSFDMVFDSITEHRRWLGILDSVGDVPPLKVGSNVAVFPLQLVYMQQNVPQPRIMQVDIPSAYLSVSDVPITNRDSIIVQKVQFESIRDPNLLTSIQFTLVSGETNIQITTTGATATP